MNRKKMPGVAEILLGEPAGDPNTLRNKLEARFREFPEMRAEAIRQKELDAHWAARETRMKTEELSAFRVWPWVFKVPEQAAFATFGLFVDSGQEREEGGKYGEHGKNGREAIIAQVSLNHSQIGLALPPLANGNFSRGFEHWETVLDADASAALVQTEADVPMLPGVPSLPNASEEPLRSNGVRLHAGDRQGGRAELRRTDRIPVCVGDFYALQTSLRVDRAFSPGHGVGACASFYDAEGLELECIRSDARFDRATRTNWSSLLEPAACAANVYMRENDPEAARRAIRRLRYLLADMLEGMRIFKAEGWHDDDVYGAVHIGRGLMVTSVIYRQLEDSGVWKPEEIGEIEQHFREIAELMTDSGYYRFDLEEFPDEKGGKRSNWNADRAAGLGVYALLFPDEKRSEELLFHALEAVDWQLEHVVTAEGSWPENVRYHGAVLHRFFLLFVLLEALRGVDYFGRGPIKAMYRFLIDVHVPEDRVQAGDTGEPRILTPAVGDANVDENWFRLFAYAAPFYAEKDPELSAHMVNLWRRGGSGVRDTGAFPCPSVALLCPRPGLAERRPDADSRYDAGLGYALFRSRLPGRQYADFAIYEASRLTYHAHRDEGHFSIWSRGVPLSLDAGTGGYYNGDRHWYVSAAAHNVVRFADADGSWGEGALTSVCEETFFSAELDYARSVIPVEGELADSEAAVAGAGNSVAEVSGRQRYTRHFLFIKFAGIGVYLVWDRIPFAAKSCWNLHALSEADSILAEEDGMKRIEAEGLANMNLSAWIAEPRHAEIGSGTGGVGGGYPLRAQQHFSVQASDSGRSDYVVFLHPHSREQAPCSVTVEPMRDSAEGVRAYRLAAEGEEIRIVLNGSLKQTKIDLPRGAEYRVIGERGRLEKGTDGPDRLELAAGMLGILSIH